MTAIAAHTFADAVATGFRTRGEFGIGTPGAMLDLWLGQQGDDVVLSMVVDAATATEDNGLHEVLADIIGAGNGRRWGIRVALSGYRQPAGDGDADHWIVAASEVHAPALSLSADRPVHAPLGSPGNPIPVEDVDTVRAPSGPVAAALANDLDTLDAQMIAACSSDVLDAVVGDWGAIDTCTIRADRSTLGCQGAGVSVEGDLTAVRHSGRRIETRVLVTWADPSDPHCAPVIEPYGEASQGAAFSSGSGGVGSAGVGSSDAGSGAASDVSPAALRAVLPGIGSAI